MRELDTLDAVAAWLAQNHYQNQGYAAPMILFGRDHWTRVRPVWPLLQHVSAGTPYGELIALTDDDDDVVDRIRAYRAG